MDMVKEVYEVTEQDAQDGVRLRQIIGCGHDRGGELKEETVETTLKNILGLLSNLWPSLTDCEILYEMDFIIGVEDMCTHLTFREMLLRVDNRCGFMEDVT